MGLVHANLNLKNPRTGDQMTVRAMADSGALLMCIPQHVALQLQLEDLERREVTLADGNRHLVPYVGPLQVQFSNRRCFTGALVLGDEALLGSVPMEDLDVLIDPARQRLIVNPESPNIAVAPVKSYTLTAGHPEEDPAWAQRPDDSIAHTRVKSLSWSAAEVLDTRRRLGLFADDWNDAGMDVYNEL